MLDRIASLLCGALVALSATGAGAAAIGEPVIDLRIWGITQAPSDTSITGPGLHGPLLDFATELDLEDGGVVRQAELGIRSSGSPAYAEAGVANDGDTFWVLLTTPNLYQRAGAYIGSEAVVRIYQSYTKDTEDASLTYTYTRGHVSAFMNVETGPMCQLNEPFCLRAGMISQVEVFDAAGASISLDFNKALVWSESAMPWGSTVDGRAAWPWEIEESGIGGELLYIVRLSEPVTNEVDLSDVTLGQEFTVVYMLYGYALDTSADAGPVRGAQVYAKDPLGGDTGVRFAVAGLTPTNNPSVLPVPEPARSWLLGTGIAILLATRGARRTAAARGSKTVRPTSRGVAHA